MRKSKKMIICALLVSMASVLAFVSKLIPVPWLQGGNITLASAVPVILTSVLFGVKWGTISSVIFAVLQMIMGFYPPPTHTFTSFAVVIMLDYIFAFGAYGLADLFYKKEKTYTLVISGIAVVFLRYICHIISGILIWGVYAEGYGIAAYSVIYNGTYMIPEIIITAAVLAGTTKLVKKLEKSNN